MAEWESPQLVFTRMIDAMKTTEDCMRILGFLREDIRYTRLATLQGNMRDKAVELAHKIADEKMVSFNRQ
jgi:hypothetical protein